MATMTMKQYKRQQNQLDGDKSGSDTLPSKSEIKLTSHAWCPQCKRIEPLIWEGVTLSSANQDFDGGDVVCQKCKFVIATLYIPWTLKMKGATHE